MAQPHTRQKRTPGIPRISSSGAFLHWLGMLAMVVGLFAPLATVEAAVTPMTPSQAMMKAAQEPFSTDTADFQRVVLVGDFQQHVGCGDWDTTCDQTQLQNINGFWTGVYGVPAGTYNWELVAIDWNGAQFSIAEGQVNVAEGQTGIYAEFNSATRENNVWATTGIAYANGVFGDVALAQEGDGYVATALNISTPGRVDMQVTVNGAPVQTGAEFQQGVSRVTFDDTGNITNVEHRGFAEVSVQRMDADGNPLPGSCFVLDGSSQTRGCDADGSPDGTGDGTTTLRFPSGFQPGSYTLRETRAAEGAEPIADQQIDVQPGQSTIEARSEGEPTPETGDLVVLRQDAAGTAVGGACFEITNANGEVVSSACDESGDVADDGRIGLLGVPAGDYTLSETRTPDGVEPAADMQVSVPANDVLNQPVQSAAIAPEEPIETEEPTEEATEPPTEEATEEPTEEVSEPPTEEATEEPAATGRIVVYREDNAGNPVGGSCFEVIDSNGQVVADNCDEDGIAADDGSTGIVDVPVGDYIMSESRVPEGFEPVPDTPVTVTEGDVIYTVTSAPVPATEPPTEEATEEPTEEVTEVPIETEPPTEEATEEATEPPTEEATEEATEPPTEEATEEPTAVGRIVVYRVDELGNPVGGSCFEVINSSGEVIGANCDEDGIAADDGSTGVNDVPVGDHTMIESRVPEGYEQAPDTPVTVTEGDVIYTVSSAQSPATEEPTEEATEEPTEEATEEPTEEIAPPTDGAALQVTYDHDDTQPKACVELESRASIGMMEIPYACDDGENDADPAPGSIRIQSLPPGDFDLVVYEGPSELVAVEPQPVSLQEGQIEPLSLESEAPQATTFTIQTNDTNDVGVAGVTFELDSGATATSDDSGLATFSDVTPGDYTVTMTGVPDGFNLADPAAQPISVAGDGSSSVTFQISRATTSLTVQTTDANGVGVAGVTFELDNGATATSDDSGLATFTDVVPGDYTVTMTGVPDGFNLADPASQPISVAGDGSSSLAFQIIRATTSFSVQTTDANGVGIAGVTFELDSGATATSDDSGLATFTDVTPGDYTVTMTGVPDGFNLADPAAQPISVAGDGSSSVAFQISRATRSFAVQTTDANGVGVAGVTFELDNGATVQSDENGVATFTGVVPGDYTVTMTGVPDGFNLADPAAQPISVAGDGSSSVAFQISRATTSFAVQTTDANGVGVAGVTFELDNGATATSDDSGLATFTDVTPGDHAITMTGVPDGFNLADPTSQSVSVSGDGSTTASFQITEVTVDIVVNTVNETTGEAVGGACYALDGNEITCDEEATGQVVFQNESPGERSLTMETAPDGFEPAADQVIPAGTTNVDVGVQQLTGTITVSVVDGDSTPIPGTCVQLDTGEPVCDADDDNDGVFTFTAPEGSHTVTISDIPEGFEPLLEGEEVQTIEVVANQDNPVTFMLTEAPPATGNVVVSVVDGESGPVSGACVQLDTEEPVCDADDENDGVFTFTAPEGSHSVTISNIPDGFEPLPEGEDVQTIEVVANQDNPVTFTLTETPPATGNLNVSVFFSGEEENPVPNACLIASMEGGENIETACDEDGDGVVNFEGILVGTYLIDLDTEQYDGPPIDPVTPVSGAVLAEQPGTATLYLTQLPTTGTLQITATDGDSNVPEACFLVGEQTVCDDQDGDTDATPGVVTITGIETNENLAVSMSRVPGGYQQPAGQNVSIQAGQTTSIEFQLEAEILPGSVTVRTTDGNGDPLNNACYRLVQGSTIIGPLCDSEPADGEVVFENVPAGDYRLEQTTRPSNQFETPSPRTVTVAPEENTLVEIEMSQRPGSLRITTVDADDTSVVLEGACYRILGDPGFGPFCDAADGNSDGIVRFTNLPAGQYELEQTVSTAGFDPAANRTVTINPGGSTQITVVNERVQPPAESGTLVVIPLDPSGNPVQGGCFQVFDGDSPVTGRICDNADDQPASITFEGLPVGDLTLRELLAPSPDWQIAADINVTIVNGETTTVEVPHEFKPGNVVIQAVNSVGLPLQGACFTLTDAGDTDLCTDSTGQSTVIGLTPGTRELTQTEAPFGFKLDETPREVIVRPGQTTTVRVVFENEPPPNTGTVQVQKFFCPAGEEGERTTFHGGAQGNQELQRTAGCEPGIAHFTLVAEDGSTESNAEFSTNAEGRAQLTAVEGIYLLTETDPDMPGNSSARLRVATGQMTTVIVINYVAPPAPAPVTINVEGYTCPPGFNGSSFVDFQNSCMAESQLTNQITVRAEAEARYKRSTGDTGVLGKTSFVDLPAGTYTIWAEQPHTVPVTYMFCGADVNSPNQKTVNGSVRVTLESGSTILCRVFQVPSLFDADHGAIQVQKFNCPINERQRGYDFQNECGRASEPIPFEIQQVDPKTGDLVGDPVRVNTNSDGIVQFPMLLPGTYKLTEVDSEWCFAQSNSVDANGDVVVQKDKLSEVWVYNCVGTKAPPNTGSGDAAGLSGPDGGLSPMKVLPNLIWPTVLLAGWLVWRDRKQA